MALLALVLLIAIMRDIRRLRAAQSVLLGGAQRDLADFAVSLQTRVDDLHRAVDEVAATPVDPSLLEQDFDRILLKAVEAIDDLTPRMTARVGG